MQDELVEDLIAIVTSFSGRVHGMRGVHGKRAGKKMDPEDRAMAKVVSDAIDAAIDDVVDKITGVSEIRHTHVGKKGRGGKGY